MEIRIERRQFATIARLPYLARLQVRDPGVKPRGLDRLVSKAARSAWTLLHYRLGLPARGEMTFTFAAGKSARVGIDAARALYIDYASRDAHGGYEPAETLLIDAILPKIRVFYDIGADWGYYSWLAATSDDWFTRSPHR